MPETLQTTIPISPINTLLARLECSFKGETVVLEAVIDLDRHLTHSEVAPDFHQILARAGGIDPYSYLYEVLESEEISFSQPTGLAIGCCVEGRLDWDGFVQRAREAQIVQAVQAIAARELDMLDLDAHTGLKAAVLAALLAAYHEGLRVGQATGR